MTKLIFSSFTIFLLCIACSSETKPSAVWMNYGPQKVDTLKAIGMEALEREMKSETDKDFTFYAPITEVCSKAGCWITVQKSDGSSMRVVFKDHFTIPPKTNAGTEAFIHGRAYWDSIPQELEQHYAEDAGKSAAEIAKIKSKFELNFEADGICFKTKK